MKCATEEYTIFNPSSGQTYSQYLTDYMQGRGSQINLVNPNATSDCHVCEYRTGTGYLHTLNLKYIDWWRNIGITVIFIVSSYAGVFPMMKLRTKSSKKAEWLLSSLRAIISHLLHFYPWRSLLFICVVFLFISCHYLYRILPPPPHSLAFSFQMLSCLNNLPCHQNVNNSFLLISSHLIFKYMSNGVMPSED